MTKKAVFLDQEAIGGVARSPRDAVKVLRNHATRLYPDAALRVLLRDLGVRRPSAWRPHRNVTEGPDGFYFTVRMLTGDIPR